MDDLRGAETRQLHSELILEGVLRPVSDEELSPARLHKLTDPDSHIVRDLRVAWSEREWLDTEGRPHWVKLEPFSLVNSAIFTDLNPSNFDSFEEFLEAARQELRSRYEQRVYFRRLDQYVADASTAEDMVSLTQAYIFLRVNARTNDFVEATSYSHYLMDMFERTGEVLLDPIEGTADPEVVAEFMLPAVRTFIDSPEMQELYRGTDDRKSGVGQFISSQLFRLPESTAEQVGSLRLRSRLHELGYAGFGLTSSARQRLHKTGDSYLTIAALKVLLGAEEGVEVELPEGSLALDDAARDIHGLINLLAKDVKYPVAYQIRQAYQRLGVVANRGGATIAPYRATIIIANAVTDQLNVREMFAGDKQLPKLNDQKLEELPMALQRILFAIDEALLREATEGSIFEGTDLRKRMAYLEALANQWRDHTQKQYFVVGDFVMQLTSMGYTPEQISTLVSEAQAGRPDTKATRHYKGVQQDWRTRTSHVFSRKRRAGYGVIS